MLINKIFNRFSVLKLILVTCTIIFLDSCSNHQVITDDLIFIQKGKSFERFLKQNDFDYNMNQKENFKEAVSNFEFTFENQTLRCNILKVANREDVRTNTNNTNNSGTSSANNTTTSSISTVNFYVITDKSNNIYDFFYVYELKTGIKSLDLKILESLNKAYMNYLIENEIFDLEDIKEMDEQEKLSKIIIH